MRERRLDGLTSLRFFACLLVVLYHYGQTTTERVPGVAALVRSGDLGVGFFFVLSGFVLAAVYAPRLRNRGVDRRRFYVARFARIYPVYLLTILLFALGWATKMGGTEGVPTREWTVALLLRLTLLSAWVPGYALLLNTPAWTLSVEALFYAIFPLALETSHRALHRTRYLWIATAIALEILGPPLVARLTCGNRFSSLALPALFFPPFHLGSFLAGLELGLVYLGRGSRSPEGRRRLRLASAVSLAVLAAVVLDRPAFGSISPDGFLALPFGFLILNFAESDDRFTFLRWSPLVLLGEASYGIYILQELVVIVVVRVDRKLGVATPVQSATSFLGYLVVLATVAVASHRFFEIPARRRLRAWLEPPGSPESQTTASGIANDRPPGR